MLSLHTYELNDTHCVPSNASQGHDTLDIVSTQQVGRKACVHLSSSVTNITIAATTLNTAKFASASQILATEHVQLTTVVSLHSKNDRVTLIIIAMADGVEESHADAAIVLVNELEKLHVAGTRRVAHELDVLLLQLGPDGLHLLTVLAVPLDKGREQPAVEGKFRVVVVALSLGSVEDADDANVDSDLLEIGQLKNGLKVLAIGVAVQLGDEDANALNGVGDEAVGRARSHESGIKVRDALALAHEDEEVVSGGTNPADTHEAGFGSFDVDHLPGAEDELELDAGAAVDLVENADDAEALALGGAVAERGVVDLVENRQARLGVRRGVAGSPIED